MALSTAELMILIKARDEASRAMQDIDRAMGGVEKRAGGLGKMFKGALTVGAVAGGAAVIGLGLALKSFVGEAAEAQRIQAQTNAVIASTKGVAGVTSEAVNKLANDLAAVIPIDDELIQSTQNMLLTFTRVGKEVFPQATEAALNMAVALGEDPVNAAMRLGKALNEPIEGVSALRRVGVQLTDAQEAQIKAFMAVNDVASAQKIILGELETEFGNSARAAGETFGGKMAILQTQIGNVKEAIGAALLPILIEFATFISGVLSRHMEEIETLFENVSLGIRAFFAAFQDPDVTSSGWVGEVERAGSTIREVFDAVRPVVEEFFRLFMLGLQTVGPVLREVFNFVIDHKVVLIAAIAAIGAAILLALGPGAAAVLALVGLITLIGLVRDHFDELKAKAVELRDAFQARFPELAAIIDFVVERVVSKVQSVIDIFAAVIDTGREIISFFQNVFRGDWEAAWQDLKDIATNLLGIFLDWLNLTFLGDLFAILAKIGPKALAYGAELVVGLWDGIVSIKDWILGKVEGLGGEIFGALKKGLGKLNPFSPSEYGIEVGEGLIEGIVLGASGAMTPAFEQLGQGLNRGMTTLFFGIRETAGAAAGAISGSLLAVMDSIMRIGAAADWAEDLLELFRAALVEDWDEALRIAGALPPILNDAGDAMFRLARITRDAQAELRDLESEAERIRQTLDDGMRDMPRAVRRALGEIVTGVRSAISGLTGELGRLVGLDTRESLEEEREINALRLRLLDATTDAEREAIQEQIDRLEVLSERRRLERRDLELRGLLMDRTLATDTEVIQALYDQGNAVGELTGQFEHLRGAWLSNIAVIEEFLRLMGEVADIIVEVGPIAAPSPVGEAPGHEIPTLPEDLLPLGGGMAGAPLTGAPVYQTVYIQQLVLQGDPAEALRALGQSL